jgi:hypothetical protein
MSDFLSPLFQNAWSYIQSLWDIFWPFIAFAFLFFLFKSTWLWWLQSKFKKEIKWVLLELRIPREIKKSPQAMEQVLATMHTLRNRPTDLQEWYWIGEVTRWYSLEMVSFGGEIHFFVRTYFKQKGLVEAAFFSYYNDVEVVEVEDYVDKFPANLREMEGQGYDLWGTEMLLERKALYPIRTYKDFEAIEEERQFDPVSVFLEVLGKLRLEEIVGIQILIAPADKDWDEEFDHDLEKMKEPKMKKMDTHGASTDMETFSKLIARSPGETDVLEAVERNLSKPAFDTLVRFIYLSPKTIFYDSFARRGLVGSFNQYAAQDLNRFAQNYPMSTRTRMWNSPYIFPRRRNDYRKQRLLYMYRNRYIPPKTWMGRLISSYIFNWNFASRRFKMNTECIATIFHPPTSVVLTAPHIKRVESRKAGPPAGLPIYGEDQSLEQFQ